MRHRLASYSQRSQRYVVRDAFDYIVPPQLEGKTLSDPIAGVPEAAIGGFLEGPVWVEDRLYLSQLDFGG